MYGKIVEDKVEIVNQLPREIVVDDRRIYNPSVEDCGLVELTEPEHRDGYTWHWGVQDGQIVPVYEEIVVESEEEITE